MSSKRVVVTLFSLFLVLVLVAVPMFAQATNTGTVIGQVNDPSGAAIAGATVSITDLSTKTARTTATNAEGRYIFVNVPPGTYDVTISQKGFRTEKFAKQTVSVGQQLTLNVTLQLGAATEVIEVTAAAGAELQTLNSTVGTGFTGVALDSLPSITREAATFAMMQPGVTPEGSVAGAVMDQNTFQLDGGQNTNDMDGAMNIYTPSFAGDPSGVAGNALGTGLPSGVMPTPIDSIEEFKVNTTQQTADFNSSAGAQVSMATRRGTDSWHGTVYEYYQDNNYNANGFANNAPATRAPLPDYHYSRFGAAGGGPIVWKKILGGKTYFFGHYEGYRFPNSTSVIREVPGPGLVQGLISLCNTENASGACTAYTVYNLNSTAVPYSGPTITSGGVTALMSGTMYNPGASPVTGGAAVAACTGTANPSCDPRNLGISPTMKSLWALMPQAKSSVLGIACGSTAVGCDGINALNYTADVTLPTRSDFAVARIDHDFGDKWHFFSSYRFYRLTRATTNQTELLPTGGIESTANRPQIPWFLVAGLTTNITTNFTNDFHYSYLRNFWQWGDNGAAPQLAGLGAALEPNGESTDGVLSPYNVNTQQIRTRYWDGQDNVVRDDMTRLLGNHVLQWGGSYQHNYNQHQRSDNGGGINYFPVDQLGTTSQFNMTGFIPAAVSALGTTITNDWIRDYGEVLGMLSTDQIVYTRSGPQLTLNPPLTPVEDRVKIPYYNVYFTDSWKIRPTVTLTYGLAWTLEMPPYEENGEQVNLVDQANQLIEAQQYLDTRKKDALLGEVFNPEIGFSLVRNAAGGLKYPYNPYYGSFSPRVGVAWNPNYDSGWLGSIFGHGKTVVRGGFSVIYGRLNGVDLVLAPLLGTGLLQPVQCFDPTSVGGCAGKGGSTPATDFRIGPTASGWDGLTGPLAAPSKTLPQPDFPGINAVSAAASEVLDPDFRPNKSYEFDFTVQRQLGSKFTVEAGYIGRVIRNEYQPIDLNAVPYMFTLGGQKFSNAWANLILQYCGGTKGLAGGNCGGPTGAVNNAVTPQPFFETALGGTTSAYCKGFASCTAAVVANEGVAGTGNLSGQLLWNFWTDLDSGPFLKANGGALPGPTMESSPALGGLAACGSAGTAICPQLTSGVGVNTSLGFGNYNSLFVTSKMADWHGLTMQSSFTYGKALGTGALYQAASEYTVPDPYWLGRGYGPQAWDRKFVLNTFLVYQPAYYKSQHGLIGHLLGGWSFAPIFVTASGIPDIVYPTSFNFNTDLWGQAFGEADTLNYYTDEDAVLVPGPGCSNFSTSRVNNVSGQTLNGVTVGNTGPYNVSLYKNPANVFNCFRNAVVGLDTGHNGGYGNVVRGQPSWNVDFQVRKSTHITERISGEFQVIFTNLFNHTQLADPFNDLNDPGDWGQLEGLLNTPRTMEFGFRVRF